MNPKADWKWKRLHISYVSLCIVVSIENKKGQSGTSVRTDWRWRRLVSITRLANLWLVSLVTDGAISFEKQSTKKGGVSPVIALLERHQAPSEAQHVVGLRDDWTA